MNLDYDELISVENLFESWRAYKRGKSRKRDVMEFERHLEDNLFLLHKKLKDDSYAHGKYAYFRISDPKKRDIYKATVEDRIVHQAVYGYLGKIYEPLFTVYSFSSRKEKGTHRAVMAFKDQSFATKRNRRRCWAMKCDVRKYFESIQHKILLEVLREKIKVEKIFRLLEIIIESFHQETGVGIPLGNITSQIFANIYLNELDKFAENVLGLKNYYVRYNDDFIIMGSDRKKILEDALKIKEFLKEKLALELPEAKTTFRKLRWGIDFCGSVVLSNGILLRNRTKARMFSRLDDSKNRLDSGKIAQSDFRQIFDSYFGLLEHCQAYNLRNKVKNRYLFQTF